MRAPTSPHKATPQIVHDPQSPKVTPKSTQDNTKSSLGEGCLLGQLLASPIAPHHKAC
jgi:hypothetical protein